MSITQSSGAGTPAATAAHRRLVERARERDEPTRTKTVRQKYAQRLRGRWDAIRAALRQGVVELNAFGLRTDALATDALEVRPPTRRDFDFDTEARQADAFETWLTEQVDREILRQFGGENQFVTRAYRRGVDDAQAELRALDVDGGAVGTTPVQNPTHREQLRNLYARNLSALEGMTDATAREMRRVLTEGLAAGDGPQDIADALADRIEKVGKTRANTIARTEIMHSHNRARATEWQRAGIQQVDILIAPDACPQCQALKAGAPYPVEGAAGLLPQHPNCRCSLTVATEST